MSNEMEKKSGIVAVAWVISTICGVLMVAAFLAAGYLLDGWVLLKLWSWLVIPITHTAFTLTLTSAIVMCLVVGFLTHQTIPSYKDMKMNYGKNLLTTFVTPLVTLCVGYVLHHFFIH